MLYNLQTRKINDGVAIIPIDLDENGKIDAGEKIYTTVDEVIAFLEKTKHPKIPAQNVNVIFNANNKNKAAIDFLQWILSSGQGYDHECGLLNLGLSASNANGKKLFALQ